MAWPAPSDYDAAVQDPRHSFEDSDLRAAAVATNPLGLPKVASGNFASVYELRSGDQRFAVRCFIREVTDHQRRYGLLSDHLAGLACPYLVGFKYVERGILVRGSWYPIVRMDWVDGEPLHVFIEGALGYPGTLLGLAKQWRGLVGALRGLNMAHGDLQHGNVLVTPGEELRLVDYDGMFVPRMRGEQAPELGHASYQHPRRTAALFDATLDNFSALVIFLGLRALASDLSLSRLHTGDNLLLTRADLENPTQSAALTELRASQDPAVQKLAIDLARFCGVEPARVPSLEAELATIPPKALFPEALDGEKKPKLIFLREAAGPAVRPPQQPAAPTGTRPRPVAGPAAQPPPPPPARRPGTRPRPRRIALARRRATPARAPREEPSADAEGGRRPESRLWFLLAAALLLLAAGGVWLALRENRERAADAPRKMGTWAPPEEPLPPPPQPQKGAAPSTKATSEPELTARFTDLYAQCHELAAKDQYGAALGLVEAFEQEDASARGKKLAADLRAALLKTARERYAEVEGKADDAFRKEAYEDARDFLRPVLETWGLDDLAQQAREKLRRLDAPEKLQRDTQTWEQIRLDMYEFVKAGRFDDAEERLKAAAGLAIPESLDRVEKERGFIRDARALKAPLPAGWLKVRQFPGVGDGGDVGFDQNRFVFGGGRWAGVRRAGFPREDYEFVLDVRRKAGGGQFCYVVCPLGPSGFYLLLGDTGVDRNGNNVGDVVLIGLVNGKQFWDSDAVQRVTIQDGRWHRLHVRVTRDRIVAHLDSKLQIDWPRGTDRFTLPPELEYLTPFGIATPGPAMEVIIVSSPRAAW